MLLLSKQTRRLRLRRSRKKSAVNLQNLNQKRRIRRIRSQSTRASLLIRKERSTEAKVAASLGIESTEVGLKSVPEAGLKSVPEAGLKSALEAGLKSALEAGQRSILLNTQDLAVELIPPHDGKNPDLNPEEGPDPGIGLGDQSLKGGPNIVRDPEKDHALSLPRKVCLYLTCVSNLLVTFSIFYR